MTPKRKSSTGRLAVQRHFYIERLSSFCSMYSSSLLTTMSQNSVARGLLASLGMLFDNLYSKMERHT